LGGERAAKSPKFPQKREAKGKTIWFTMMQMRMHIKRWAVGGSLLCCWSLLRLQQRRVFRTRPTNMKRRRGSEKYETIEVS
jgi:hypothetical protein